ncbi:hypothetical protein [Nocardiopsis sp. CNR-923]|uniref:hypothetical protein n=1 Tax=Nocardiopsis sp. CNR-923 TaxID=1904965 RepID=UPI000AE67C52|nr:hypothetical protein [Nocardiopsis sp. CNR-923]
MRSLRDDELQIGGPIGPGTVAGAPGTPSTATRVGRSGVGEAPARWKPSIDREHIGSVLAYLRACLSREGVQTHVVRAEHLGSDVCACLPPGPELLFSGAQDTVPLHPGGARVLHLARLRGQALRYGYPLVVLGEGADRVALPLLTTASAPRTTSTDCRAIPDRVPRTGPRSARSARPTSTSPCSPASG